MLLSICIPSYNRFKIFVPDLKNMLTAKSSDFEVVVVDNCSTQDTSDLDTIKDPRLKVIYREKAVSGPYNVGDCLRYAQGDFSMLCLDKDRLLGEKLDEFIEILKQHKDVCGGYCFQNFSNQEESVVVYDKGTLDKFGFLNKHPSGNFYRSLILREFYEKFPASDIADPFMFDLFLSYCAVQGKMMLYKKPMVFLERPEDSSQIKSFSFHKSDNTLFFFPDNRIQEFLVYLRHLSSYNISSEVKYKEIAIIYGRTVGYVTFGYKACAGSDTVSNHYNFEKRSVSYKEMCAFKRKLEQIFLETNLTDLDTQKRKSMIQKQNLKFHLKYIYFCLKYIYKTVFRKF